MTGDHDDGAAPMEDALAAAAAVEGPVAAVGGSVDHVEGTVREALADQVERRALIAWGKERDTGEVREESVTRGNELVGVATVAYVAGAPDDDAAEERFDAVATVLKSATKEARRNAEKDTGESAVVERTERLTEGLPGGEEAADETLHALAADGGYDEWVERLRDGLGDEETPDHDRGR